MKNLINTVIASTQLITHRPNKEIQYKQQIEKRLQEQKSIGIKKTLIAKQTTKKFAGKQMTVGATAYYGDTITSTGVKPIVGMTIAVDPNVIPYGTRVYVPQLDKIFIAQDCGSAIKGNRIDIFMNSYDECMEWGYKTITIYILED